MILFRAEAILASSTSKFGKFLSATDRDDLNSSIESTISTSLIHNIAFDGKSGQERKEYLLFLLLEELILVRKSELFDLVVNQT